jgi:hypothetical protein
LDSFPPSGEDNAPPVPYEAGNDEDAAWKAGDIKNFGGVQYVSYGDQARLRWDTERVHAVAVDGQHRLVALRQFREEVKNKALSRDEQKTRIPVLVLLLSPEVGYQHSGNAKSIRLVARELFTDLNKNAKPVDRARELILDDRSVVARCVRTLVTDETARDATDRLPLSLVRWQDAINRFDSSYYINSLIHLDLLVKDALLGFEEISDPMDAEEVVRFLETAGKALGDNTKTLRDASGRSAVDVYKSEYLDSEGGPLIPYWGLTGGFLDAATRGFEKNFRPWLIKILTTPAPYARVLEYARKNNLIEGAFGKYYAQTKAHRAVLQTLEQKRNEYWYRDEISIHEAAIEALKGGKGEEANWAFKAIFQKALVRLAKVVAFDYASDPLFGGVERLIELIDGLDRSGVLKVGAPLDGHEYSLWTLIATNPVGGTIRVNKKTEERILAVLRLWLYGNAKLRADLAHEQGKKLSARQLVQFFSAESNATTWPGCAKAVGVLREALNAKVLVKDKGAEAADEVIRDRIASMMQAGLVIPLP